VLDSLSWALLTTQELGGLVGQRHFLVFLRGKVGGSICGGGSLRILEKQAVRLVQGEPTSCELTQLLPLGRVGFRALAVLKRGIQYRLSALLIL